MAITHPSDISGLVLDLDPHEAAYQDTGGSTPAGSGDSVARVDDQTATGANVTQSTSANRPTLQQDAQGWLYLDCDGVDDGLSHASFAPTSGGTQPFSIIAVINVTSLTANGVIANDGSTTHLAVRQENQNQNTHFPTRLRQTNVLSTGLQVWDHRINGASSSLWRDGATAIDGDAGSDAWSAGLWIGRRSDGVAWAGHIYRVLIYDKVLTNTERTDLNSYLAALYASPPPSSGNSVVQTFEAPVDWQASLEAAKETSIDWTAAAEESHELPADWLGQVAIAAELPADWLLDVTVTREASLDWLLSANSAAELPADWLLAVVASDPVPIDWTGQAVISATAEFPIDWTGQLSVSSELPADWIAAAGITYELPTDWLLDVTAAGEVPIDWDGSATVYYVAAESLPAYRYFESAVGERSFESFVTQR